MAVRKELRRGEPRLVIDIRYKDERTGRRSRYRKDAQVQTAAAARAENQRRLAELGAKGFLADPEPDEPAAPEKAYTFADAVALFRETKAVTLKSTTRRGYNVLLDARLLPRFRDEPLASIDHEKASRLEADMVAAGLSASARGNVQIALRSVLRCAVEAKRLPAMPDLPDIPKGGRKVVRPPRREDVDAVLAAANPAVRRALLLAADAGLRAGEIRGLRWCDVDLGAGALYVRRTIYRGAADTPKSGHEREVPLTPRLAANLAGAHDPDVPGEAPVAPTSLGLVWGESGLYQAFAKAVRRTGLPPARLHDLRHFFVTQCFAAGGDAPTVQALAGHEHLSTTQIYAHTDADAKRAVVRRLAATWATAGQRVVATA